MILIITAPDDEPAILVESILRSRGAEVLRFDIADFPAQANLTISYRPGVPRYCVRVAGNTHRFDRVDAVWYRKPGAVNVHAAIQDEEVRNVLGQDCREFLSSFWESLDARALPGTPSDLQYAQRKASQLGRAQALGFELAPTIVSNDPAEFLDLYRSQSGRLISKIIGSLTLRSRMGSEFMRYTNTVSTRDVMHAQSIAHGPLVLQSYVPKKMEIRVTVVGQRVFACEIHSQTTNRTRFDWRRYDLRSTPHKVHELPADVARRCVDLVAQSRLTYGTIDLILTPDDRYVFLELNSAGEYGWIEQLTGLPISAAIADLLLGDTAASATNSPRKVLYA
ncbi:MAG: MvdC/MvdD family ATP grasp protein [Steroidobacteraceae bacterium]